MKSSYSFCRNVLVLGLLLNPVLCGCGKQKEPWETAYPAKGSLTRNGKPIANADISFFPENTNIPDSVRPKAKSGDDGTFVVWTYLEGDGAPAGRYRVTVVHNEVAISNGAVVTKPNDLPAKYASLATTDLQTEIGTEDTEIPPFDLK
jgi:hypothetical protein